MKLNRTAVLGFIGVAVGLVCSIYTAIKATPKAEQLKKEAEENKGEPLTKKEVLKVVGKEYIPTAVAALGCVASAGLSAREFAGKQVHWLQRLPWRQHLSETIKTRYEKFLEKILR